MHFKIPCPQGFPFKTLSQKKDDNGALVIIVLILLQDKKILSQIAYTASPYSVYQFVGIPSLSYYNYNRNNECDH